jgi:outer membrane protein assembly factor BamB
MNRNGLFDPSTDKPLQGIGVSDGEQVVLSSNRGEYSLSATTATRSIFVVQPAGFERRRDFYRVIPGNRYSDDGTSVVAGEATSKVWDFDFPLNRNARPDPRKVRFVQTTDIHISGPEDSVRFSFAIDEINRLSPAADFVVATGDLVNTADKIAQLETYTSVSQESRMPWFHVFGNHDANKRADRTAEFRRLLAPDYYSADFGDLHLVMLNSIHRSERQDEWLERDIRLFGRGKTIIAFQHYPPKPDDIERFKRLGVKAVFSGHWHSNKITLHGSSLLNVNHPTLLMGGIDGSPSSFRIISVENGKLTSEFRVNSFEKRIWSVHPQNLLAGPPRLLANLYDTVGGVKEARYELLDSSGLVAGGPLKQVSPFSWSAPLGGVSPRLKGPKALEFTLNIRAKNQKGEEWKASHTVAACSPTSAPEEIRLGDSWPMFMGNAQRTGVAAADPELPLGLKWFASTGGCIDLASPVLQDGRLAIGVKDRDNLGRNGVAILPAQTGKDMLFVKTRAMINHSPAFLPEGDRKVQALYAASTGGDVYRIHPETGNLRTLAPLGNEQQRWIYSSPACLADSVLLGSSPALASIAVANDGQQWCANFGVDWISSYASPSVWKDVVLMGAVWLDKDGKKASVFALDRQTGQPRWTNECGGVSGSIAVADGKGYAVDTRGLLKVIDLADGKDMLTKQLDDGWSLSTPAVDGEIVVVPTGANAVYAFDRATLEQKWVFRAEAGLWKMAPYDKVGKAVFSSPTITGNRVLIGCSDGCLYVLDKASGEVRWRYDFGVPTLSTPCISGNAVFTAAYDGNVYAFTPLR